LSRIDTSRSENLEKFDKTGNAHTGVTNEKVDTKSATRTTAHGGPSLCIRSQDCPLTKPCRGMEWLARRIDFSAAIYN
jgi:hypothetical protein